MINLYIDTIVKKIYEIQNKEKDKFQEVADRIYSSLSKNGVLHVFGTGHSNLLAQDLIYRAGGLVPINLISNPSITLEHDPVQASMMEKVAGISEVFLQGHKIEKNDVFLIISTSGCNQVPIEISKSIAERGLFTIGITSKDYSEHIKVKKNITQSLYDIVDVVFDNRVGIGDCCLQHGTDSYGTMSTILVSSILNSIIIHVIEKYNQNNQNAPIFVSNNLSDQSSLRNAQLLDYYEGRLHYT
ncbi:sugar isomerase domain-containing protein [Alkaliphilus hydrothermalis]|uniref:Phosphosugar-binding protein n=1 Tax=Alkaliphilus hydrothermalis TaxID=1482730 RepID=A0ABS2NUE7_9FIRM|nr:sugar isomerase domain-containing protein [Alkaliphilus hydrothermalis]MBM7616209.1 putative phosphosugar-binding protein [Alkaliphilus hydrothermalis]